MSQEVTLNFQEILSSTTKILRNKELDRIDMAYLVIMITPVHWLRSRKEHLLRWRRARKINNNQKILILSSSLRKA